MRVWRASDLSLVRVLRGHRGSVLTLLAVGSVLLSGARDNAIRCVWWQGCRGGLEPWDQHCVVSGWPVSKQSSVLAACCQCLPGVSCSVQTHGTARGC